MGYLDNYMFDGEYITWTTDGANAGTVFYRNGKFNCTNVCGTLKIHLQFDCHFVSLVLQQATQIWGIERSGFFNGQGKWAKGFENQMV